MRTVLFVGKGGVGKTTCAVLASASLSRRGYRVLLTSVDPAQNLTQLLRLDVEDRLVELKPNLHVYVPNIDQQIERYLAELAAKLRKLYKHLQVFNLDSLVDVVRYTPGIEEHIVLEMIRRIVQELGTRYDYVIIDCPPSSLMTRVLLLPLAELEWTRNLIKLREAILQKRRMIENVAPEELTIRIGESEFKLATSPEEDPVYRELKRFEEEVRNTVSMFTSRDTVFAIVVNPEYLPIVEASRLKTCIQKLKAKVSYVIVNRHHVDTQCAAYVEEVRKMFPDAKLLFVPVLPELRGLDSFEKYSTYLDELT